MIKTVWATEIIDKEHYNGIPLQECAPKLIELIYEWGIDKQIEQIITIKKHLSNFDFLIVYIDKL